MNTVVVGAQWGDEGKGKIIDILSAKADVVVRYQGGNNAGHTVVKESGEFVLHLIPSGILHKKVHCVIASGVVVDPQALLEEIQTLESKGISVKGRLWVSERAQENRDRPQFRRRLYQVVDTLGEFHSSWRNGPLKFFLASKRTQCVRWTHFRDAAR